MSLLRQAGLEEILKALAMGAVAVRARQGSDLLLGTATGRRRHTLPELTGAPVEDIANACLTAILAAHAPAEPDGEWSDAACASCTALIDLGSHYGDPTHMVWPDPVRRALADVLDAELVARKARHDE